MQELPQRGPTGQTGSYQFFPPALLNTSSATLIALSLRSADGTSPGIPSPRVDNDNFVGGIRCPLSIGPRSVKKSQESLNQNKTKSLTNSLFTTWARLSPSIVLRKDPPGTGFRTQREMITNEKGKFNGNFTLHPAENRYLALRGHALALLPIRALLD